MYHLFKPSSQGRRSGTTGVHLVAVARRSCHIGMALLTALPVSTGKASTLSWLVFVRTVQVDIRLLFARVCCTAAAEQGSWPADNLHSSQRSEALLSVSKATYSHAYCNHKTERRANDFAMAGILIACTGQHMSET